MDFEEIQKRITACVIQAQMNAKNTGGNNATAAADLICAFVLISMQSGAQPDKALNAIWEDAKATVYWLFQDTE